MFDIRGQPLLRQRTRTMNDPGIHDIRVVAGCIPEAIDLPDIKKALYLDCDSTGKAASLDSAASTH